MRNITNNAIMSKEDIISMFLGLAIVGVVMLVLVNYFKNKSGRVDLDGLTDSITSQESSTSGDSTKNNLVSGSEYIVVKGDSLWSIAQKQLKDGYKWVEIAKMNGISDQNANIIEVGQKLKLPEIKKIVLPIEHVVSLGDSLSKIANRYYGDMMFWNKIWNVNKDKIVNPDLIHVGLILTIPE